MRARLEDQLQRGNNGIILRGICKEEDMIINVEKLSKDILFNGI